MSLLEGFLHAGDFAVRYKHALATILANIHVSISIDLAQIIPTNSCWLWTGDRRNSGGHGNLTSIAIKLRLASADRLRNPCVPGGCVRSCRCGGGGGCGGCCGHFLSG